MRTKLHLFVSAAALLGLTVLARPAWAARTSTVGSLSLGVAAGGSLQIGGGASEERSSGAAFELGLGLDVGRRLRFGLGGTYLPDAATDRSGWNSGTWRLGPTVRLYATGSNGTGGLWLGLGGGMGLDADLARPFARGDLGWSFGRHAQIGLVVSFVRELDDLADGGSFAVAGIRFDGLLDGLAPAARAAERAPEPVAAPPPPAPLALVQGEPLSDRVVRGQIREHRRDIEDCVALAGRRGTPLPPRIDLQLLIAPSGEVQDVEVDSDLPADAGFQRCVRDRVRRWPFPTAQGHTSFSAPFIF